MENQENRKDEGLSLTDNRKDEGLSLKKDTQINLVVSNTDADETTIDLGRVFHNFKARKRVFAWLLLFCLVAGISAGLLMYQIQKKPLTVSSVVTLRYQVTERDADGNIKRRYPVDDLTAPDASGQLDLTQITSAYVLQNALQDITLSRDISLSALRGNITIMQIPSEKNRQQQELISSMMEESSLVKDAYSMVQEMEMLYSNQFIVYLTNGFGQEDAPLTYLEDDELPRLLNKILEAYNDYLVQTYAMLKVPDDEISVIDTASVDLMEGLDLLRSAVNNLSEFCNSQAGDIRTYRSWQTGFTLEELQRKLELVRDVNVNYLYSYVYTNNIARDAETMLTKYQFDLRSAQSQLEEKNAEIADTKEILDNYKNDEIYVSLQESDSAKSASFTTDYYNNLTLAQTENYKEAAELSTTISELQEKIANLTNSADSAKVEEASEELNKAVAISGKVYTEIADHIEEIMESPFYRTYADASAAQGKSESFLTGASKNMIMFGAVGAILALGLWFLSALAPEFRREENDGKEKENKEEAKA